MNKITKLLTGAVLGAGVAYGYEKYKEKTFKESVTYWIEKLAKDSDMEALAKLELEAELKKSDSDWHDFVDMPDKYAMLLLTTEVSEDGINSETNNSDEI